MYLSVDCWLRLKSTSVYSCHLHIIAWYTSSVFRKPDSLFSLKPFQSIPSYSFSMFLNKNHHSHARNAPFLLTFPKQKAIKITAIPKNSIQRLDQNNLMYFKRFWNQLRGLTRKSFIQMKKHWFANLFMMLLPGILWIKVLRPAIVTVLYSTMSTTQSSQGATPISIEKLDRCVPLDPYYRNWKLNVVMEVNILRSMIGRNASLSSMDRSRRSLTPSWIFLLN